MLNYIFELATDKKRGFFASWIKFLLYLLSLVYGAIIRFLIFLQKTHPKRLNCKVISIGNITLGGTGKTSLVEVVASHLKQRGQGIAVLSRGYKKKSKAQNSKSRIDYRTMGDEPYMLSKNLKEIPIIVDKDRVRAAKRAIEGHSIDTVILDDGLQQWRIAKDLEIVTLDATNPFGNQHLLPRGILREPLSSLKRADIFVLTKTNLMPNAPNAAFGKPDAECSKTGSFSSESCGLASKRSHIRDLADIENFLTQINPQALIFEAIHKGVGFYRIKDNSQSLFGLQLFKEKTVGLLCGIADPDSFENLVLSLGMEIGLSFRFPDHHNYTQSQINKVLHDSKTKGIDTLITTEKDAVRLADRLHFRAECYVLKIELEIIQNEAFLRRINSLY